MTPHQRCDLLIIGAGPAGMAAALAAAPRGLAITLVDDNIHPGGQIWRDGPGSPTRGSAAAHSIRSRQSNPSAGPLYAKQDRRSEKHRHP